MPTVSIIIRTKNEEQYLEQTLNAILSQQFDDFEIIIVDSGSTDQTLEIIQKYNVRLIEIPPEDFKYGYALNLGAQCAKGEYLFNLSAHAVPARSDLLNKLLTDFSDQKVAGVYGRQLPLSNANPLVKRDYELSYKEKKIIQKEQVFFSNVCAMIRKKIWEKFPFDESLPYCEDWDWTKHIQAAGYYVIYEPEAEVYHSHNENLVEAYKRARNEGIARRIINPENPFKKIDLVLTWAFKVKGDWLYLLNGEFQNRLKCFFYSPLYRFSLLYGRYKGWRAKRNQRRFL